ncbi:hypothetical protein B484DRAFT_480387 [Ochromonadaceae sp. CCMP2298]|nr:hypothetical protein B484DRAFT_480387 [Ochromonadaceae sp. CCMP2298]
MAQFSDTKIILHELEALFNRDDDIKDILDLRKMQTEIDVQMTLRLKDAKEVIKAMTSQVAEKEAQIKAPSQAEHVGNMRKLSNKENLTSQTDSLAKNIDLKRQNVTKMAATGLSLKERASEFSISADMADSRTAYAISLYAKVSNITWDYKAAPGKLAGCIGVEERRELRSFEIDTRACDSFQLANQLWEMIESSQE